MTSFNFSSLNLFSYESYTNYKSSSSFTIIAKIIIPKEKTSYLKGLWGKLRFPLEI